MSETVYESSDLPEDDQLLANQQERFESEHIESIQLDVGAAFQRFKGKQLNTNDADFSDSIGARKKKGYRGGGFVHELLGTREEPESAQERFNRLQQEIMELGDQVAKISEGTSGGGEEGVVGADVARLQEELSRVSVEGVVGVAYASVGAEPGLAQKLSETVASLREKAASGKGKTEAVVGNYELRIGATETRVARATQLEGRLAKVEAALGAEWESQLKSLGGLGGGGGLSEAVERLERRVSLLDPGAMEAADSRLGAVLDKLNRLREKREEMDSGDAELVSELHEKMSKWDELSSALPDLVARLHALQDLHQQALQFGQSLTMLDEAQQQLVKTLASDRAMLQETKSSMAANLEEIQKACKNLESRMSAIKK